MLVKTATNKVFFLLILISFFSVFCCKFFSIGLNKKVCSKKLHTMNFLGRNHLEIDKVIKSQQSLLELPDNFISNQTAILKLTNFENVQYYGHLFVGSQRQKVSVIFDSGSNILWLPSNDCLTCRDFSNKFEQSTSSTFSTLNISKNITVILSIHFY